MIVIVPFLADSLNVTDLPFLSEIFKIVEGALRLDSTKVRNYAQLLAEKLDANGDQPSARRLRRLLEEPGNQLRPLRMEQTALPPVDGESRFPLLERVNARGWEAAVVLADTQAATVDEFVHVVKHRAALDNLGLGGTPSLLLYGPPGCGKTHLAVEIARRLELPIYAARLDGLISSFLGSTAKNIRAIFEFAARTPCILFLDEFDAIAKVRDDQQELGELKRVVNSFIQTLDTFSRDLIVIAATNHQQLLDSAVWRRFAFQLEVGLPVAPTRERLWRQFAGEQGLSDRDLEILTDLSEGLPGAAIKAVADRIKTRTITHQEKPTLKSAVRSLAAQGSATHTAAVLRPELLDDPVALQAILAKRSAGLYSLAVLSAITGVPKSTLSRRLQSPENHQRKPRVNHARRALVH